MHFSAVLLAALSAATFGYAQTMTGGDGASYFPTCAFTGTHTDRHACILVATFYAAGTGSCGFFNTDADFIVAVDAATIQNFPGATANPNA